jgi:hypothetical protein
LKEVSSNTVVSSWNEWDPLKQVIVGRAGGSVVKILLSGPLTFISFLFLFFGCQVSGVSVQDILLRLPFLTPET